MGQIVTKIKEAITRSINWIREHPYKTAMCAMNTAVVIAPALFTAPFLMALGFTPLGPAAGSMAASLHSILSPLAAGGVFSTLQSAAMGGYGAAFVGAAARAGATAGIAMIFDGDDSDGDDEDGSLDTGPQDL